MPRKKRELNNKILIVCGGESEKLYLQKFNLELAEVTLECKYDHRNPKANVEKAIDMMSKAHYKQVWCVFDKDNFSCFDDAIVLAEKNSIRCAFSNQAYELWYILHFQRKEGLMHRDKYSDYLTKHIGRKYSKTDNKMYETLVSKMDIAINNSKIGHQLKQRNGGKPSDWESCTTMYKLIEELLKWKI